MSQEYVHAAAFGQRSRMTVRMAEWLIDLQDSTRWWNPRRTHLSSSWKTALAACMMWGERFALIQLFWAQKTGYHRRGKAEWARQLCRQQRNWRGEWGSHGGSFRDPMSRHPWGEPVVLLRHALRRGSGRTSVHQGRLRGRKNTFFLFISDVYKRLSLDFGQKLRTKNNPRLNFS